MNIKVVRIRVKQFAFSGFWMVVMYGIAASGFAAGLWADDRGATRISIQDSVLESKPSPSAGRSGLPARPRQSLTPQTQVADAKSSAVDAKNGTGMALPTRGKNRTLGSQPSKTAARGSLTNLGLSLGLVLAVFFGLVWLLRRVNPTSSKSGIPSEVVQILGRAPLNGRQSMQLVRLGDKILLLAISSSGTEPLGEISDRDEVDAITEICRSRNQNKIVETFRETLTRVRRDRMTGQQRTVVSRTV